MTLTEHLQAVIDDSESYVQSYLAKEDLARVTTLCG